MRPGVQTPPAVAGRLLTGAAVAVAALAAVAAGTRAGVASAQQSGADFAPLTPTATAYYTHPAGEAVPGVLTDEVPPAVVCLLIPEACGEEISQVTGPLGEAVPDPASLPAAPAQPVPPDTLPVATLAGAPRYEAAVRFELPAVPAEHRVDRFVLRLAETDPTYSLDSPAFRQAVLAAFVSIEEQQPADDQFAAVLEANPVDEQFLGVEACPLVEPFEEGGNQPAGAVPEADCVLGANGARGDDGAWEFDLTLAADAWQRGDLPTEGVLLRPIGAPNLAFGDPDVSTNEQVTFGLSDEQPPAVAVASSQRPEPLDFAPAPAPGPVGEAGPRAPPDGPVAVARPPAVDRPEQPQPAPQVAEPDRTAAPAPPHARQPGADRPDPQNLWWYWLSVPALLGGMYVTTRALTAADEPPGTAAGGALTSLMARRGGPLPGGDRW